VQAAIEQPIQSSSNSNNAEQLFKGVDKRFITARIVCF
jgi:hypothetical protein